MSFDLGLLRKGTAVAVAYAVVALSACADQTMTSPNGDAGGVQTPGATADLASGCSATVTSINNLLVALYPSGKSRTAAQGKFSEMQSKWNAGKVADARQKMYELINDATKQFYDGKLIGGTSTTTANNLSALINGLLCLGGVTAPPVVVGPSSVAQVVTAPQTAPVLIRTPDKLAGMLLPPGSVVTTTLITIAPQSGAGPLNTDLDQFPLFYDFSSSAGKTAGGNNFANDVTVGMCVQGLDYLEANYPTVAGRIQVAHNIGPNKGDVEILPRDVSTVLGLECATVHAQLPTYAMSGGATEQFLFASTFGAKRALGELARLVLPTEAQAAAMGTCCLTGGTRNLSPFGIVDPLSAEISIVPPSSFSVAPNTQVTAAIKVTKIADAFQRPGLGVGGTDVSFVSTGGAVGTAATTTNANGEASTTWTIPAGSNTLTADAKSGRANGTFGLALDPQVPVANSPVQFTGTGTAATALTYGAANWRFTTGAPSGDFTSPGFDDSGWSVGTASFGTNIVSDGCTQYADIQTPWATNSTIYLRRQFLVSGSTTAGTINLAIDNDVTVWVNGTLVSGDPTAHEGCANRGDFSFPVTVTPGVNTIVVKAVDRGSSTYFDAEFVPNVQIN